MRIILVAGELSGDQLGEDIISLLRDKYPQAQIEGVVGYKMIRAGCKKLYFLDTLSIVGIYEVGAISVAPGLLSNWAPQT